MLKNVKEIRDKLVTDDISHSNMHNIKTADFQYNG